MQIKTFILDTKLYFFISFGYNRSMLDEIKKCITNAKWSPDNNDPNWPTSVTVQFKKENDLPKQGWWFPITARNSFHLKRINGENVYEKYDKELITPIPFASKKFKEVNWGHQHTILLHMYQRKHCITAAEPRTGKTLPCLELIDLILNSLTQVQKEGFPAWFITSKSAKQGILEEIIKWKFFHLLDKLIILTYAKFRQNYNEDIVPPRIIIYDECHALKNPGSIQSKTAKEITEAQIRKYGEDCYRILMSGSPAPRSPDDWWNLCEIACPGFLGNKSKTSLAEELGDWTDENENGEKLQYKVLEKWHPEKVRDMFNRLQGLVLAIWKKDCMDLPDIIYEWVKCECTQEQMETLSLIKSTPEFNKGAQLRLKLRQISDGFIYTYEYPDDKKAEKLRVTTHIECGKYERFRMHLDEFSNSGRLVAYGAFTATIDKLVDIALEEGWAVWRIDGRGQHVFGTQYPLTKVREQMDRSRNDGIINKLIVVTQQESGAEGLEFSATCVQLGISSGQKADKRSQAEQRPHSNNMDKEKGLCFIDYDCMPIDRLVVDTLKNHYDIQNITLGQMQKSIEELLKEKEYANKIT